jgi:GR25 family glycosyltransferase involved in LPS biosynthesis
MTPAFVIALQNHQYSQSVLSDCLKSAEEHNWNVEIFPAVNGNDITEQTWRALKLNLRLDKPTMDKPGVHGCFLSHWHLWHRCISLNTDIIILEHDGLITMPLPYIPAKKIIKLHLRTYARKFHVDPDTGNWTNSAHAYLISPQNANKLINYTYQHGVIPVDILIGDNVVEFEHLNYDLVKLNPITRLSTTTEINAGNEI